MQEHPSCHAASAGDSQSAEEAALRVLLGSHPALLRIDDLVRELVEAPARPRYDEPDVEDAVADLVRFGLAQRLESYVVLTRAAIRAEILIG
jgi:hypothetical protein